MSSGDIFGWTMFGLFIVAALSMASTRTADNVDKAKQHAIISQQAQRMLGLLAKQDELQRTLNTCQRDLDVANMQAQER